MARAATVPTATTEKICLAMVTVSPVGRHGGEATVSNAGGFWLVLPADSTADIGHPRIAITAVGLGLDQPHHAMQVGR